MEWILLYILAALVLVCIAISVFDVNRFVVRKYDIDESKCARNFRIVHISDLHNKKYGQGNRRLKKQIAELHPDLIIMSGDIMTADTKKVGEENADELVLSLASDYPVYFSLGNHEDKMKNRPDKFGSHYEKARRLYSEAGVKILDNESVFLKDYGIRISGLNIERKYYKRTGKNIPDAGMIEKLTGNKDNDHMQILLAHNPLYFDAYASWGADLVLSGHVHGGIVRIPGIGGVLSPDCTLFPRYDGGRFEEQGTVMIVSRGLGTHTIPIRVFNPGELVCVDVHKHV